MRKGFKRKPQGDEPATRGKNYITPSGLQRLKDEHQFLLTRERPAVVEVVAWAASNGDRSENTDYQCGKRRLPSIFILRTCCKLALLPNLTPNLLITTIRDRI